MVLATILGIFARALKQPLIIAYIFSGIIISLLGIFKGIDRGVLESLSNLGIAFLLFLVGIELKLEDLKSVGKAALLTGVGQIVFTALIGFIILSALGFSPVVALYVAVAITFSSTVIIIKLLSEKHDLQSLYGKIAVGFLLVQDFVAILALMILSGFGNGGIPSFLGILWVLLNTEMKLSYDDIDFLLTSDCDLECEKKLPAGLQSEILKVSNHGSLLTTGNEFISKVSSEVAVISVSEKNQYNNPKQQVIDRLSKSDIYRTDLDGTVTVETNGKTYSVKTEK